jgi:hypothetical protein
LHASHERLRGVGASEVGDGNEDGVANAAKAVRVASSAPRSGRQRGDLSVAVLTAGGEFGGRPEASAEVGAARIVERHT